MAILAHHAMDDFRMSASYGWYPPPHHLGYFGPGPVGLAAGGWGLRGGINKGRGHRGRRHGPVQDRQGDFSQPSLNQLRKQNRHKAKKHYKGERACSAFCCSEQRRQPFTANKPVGQHWALSIPAAPVHWSSDFGSTPRSVPPAPDVTGSFLLPEGEFGEFLANFCLLPISSSLNVFFSMFAQARSRPRQVFTHKPQCPRRTSLGLHGRTGSGLWTRTPLLLRKRLGSTYMAATSQVCMRHVVRCLVAGSIH